MSEENRDLRARYTPHLCCLHLWLGLYMREDSRHGANYLKNIRTMLFPHLFVISLQNTALFKYRTELLRPSVFSVVRRENGLYLNPPTALGFYSRVPRYRVHYFIVWKPSRVSSMHSRGLQRGLTGSIKHCDYTWTARPSCSSMARKGNF